MRILFCCPVAVDPRLGVPKHYLELTESFRELGWDACVVGPEAINFGRPKASNSATCSSRLRDYLRRRAPEFDVVEFNVSSLPFPRDDFSRQTLFVARCTLLDHHFRTISIPPLPRLRSRIGHLILANSRRRARNDLIERINRTVLEADLTVVSNDRDAAALIQDGADRDRLAIFPLGLTAARRRQFEAVPVEPPIHPVIGFVGTFDPRKGLCEFPTLVEQVTRRYPDIVFRLLGTAGMVPDAKQVREYFPRTLRPRLEVHSQYDPSDLPSLLTGVSVGVFPSRVESFGYGVLEMLAAGIPVVAYDAPGPHVMLPPDYLTPVGAISELADRVCDLLSDSIRLRTARLWARARAADFAWEEIAVRTAEAYTNRLARLRVVAE